MENEQVQPASFLFRPVAAFSRHSREQYSDMRDLAPIARSAGIQVPQETQRTSLFSILVDRAREPEDESFSNVPLRADNTFCRS